MFTVESPAFAESIKEGNINFLKKVGDSVTEDEKIAEVETDKTTMDVKSPKSGVIEAILVDDGSTIAANTPIIKLRLGGAPAAASAAKPSEAPAPAATKKEEPKSSAAPLPPPAPSQQAARITPLPTAPSQSIPLAQIPITPASISSASIDINKITGTRAETRVRLDFYL